MEKLKLEEAPYTPLAETPQENKAKTVFWQKVIKTRKVKKPNMVAVLYLRNNGIGEPVYVPSIDGEFKIDGKIYHERTDCKFFIQVGKDKVPLAVIPEYSLVAIGTKQYNDLPLEVKFGELQDLCIKGIRNAEIVRAEGDKKGGMNNKVIIALIILGIIGFAFLKNYI